jgi:hypothetical protein
MSASQTSEPLRLLVAAPMLYHPRCGNGGGVLCFDLLRHLAPHAELHFVGFGAGPGAAQADDEALQALQTVARSVLKVEPPAARGGALGALQQLATGLPREVRDLRSATMRARLAEVAARERVHAVLLQFPHMAQYVDALPGRPVIIDVQDACMVSRYREWQASTGGLLRRWRRLHSWWAWARHERHCYRQAQGLMALSDTDLGVLRAFVPEVPAFLSGAAWETAAAPSGGAATPQAPVIFMGNFAHAPNADGLRWLLAEVWPRVRASCPQARLQVIGRNLPVGFGSDEQAGVQAVGFVEDLRPWLAAAAVSLVPYRFGGGIKIKALEAMAQGCPVVATRVGSEGLHAVDGVHMRIADEPQAFADAVVQLLQQPALRQQQARQALALVAARFSWAGKVEALLAELQGVVQAHAPRRAVLAA